MPHVTFTPHLNRWIECPGAEFEGRNVRQVLESVFRENPKLKNYLLDDQSRLRKHVAVFVDGEMIRDRDNLTDEVGETGEIYFSQALSGG